MNKTFKKITTSITAAVLCALPLVNSFTASAAANANARYTYRKVFAVSSSKNIDRLVFGVACKTYGTDAPVADQIGSGSLTRAGGGSVGCHSAGGTFEPSNHNMVGGMVSVHMHCNSPSNYKEISVTNFAYDPNGKLINNAVSASPTFLVGDINLDKKIDAKDYDLLYAAVAKMTTKSYRYKFNYFEVMNVAVGDVSGNFSAYEFDINNDGYLSSADTALFQKYARGDIDRFAE